MAKKTTSLPVLKKNRLAQEDVPDMLKVVNEKIAALKGESEKAKQTSGEIKGFGNIYNMERPENLIRAYSSIQAKEAAYNKAVKSMKLVNAPEFKLDGFTAKQWFQDITDRYSVVTHKEQLDKLNQVKEELSKHVSQEEKLNQSLLNIQDILAS